MSREMTATNPSAGSTPTQSSRKEHEMVITRVFDAPPSLVFAAWTRPEHLVNWWGRHHYTLSSCEVDLRPGGTFRFCMRSPAGRDYRVKGVYREIVEPERLVFQYGLENEDLSHESLATVTFAEQNGKTKFTMHQILLDPAQAREGAEEGWTEVMQRLENYLRQLKKGAQQ